VHAHANHLTGSGLTEVEKKKRMVAIGTLVAFSFHSFLEGLALGSENLNVQLLGFILVFSLHKAMDG
jgi:zinc transporter ZupT